MEQTEKSPVDLSNWSSPLPGRVSIKSKPDAPRAYRGSTKTHQGVDIPAAPGTDVLAIGDGKVYYVRRGWVPGAGKGQEAGNFVIVDHGNGLRSEYMHLSDITVERGQMVRGGTAIAKSGQTGGARAANADAEPMAPHLHFGIQANDAGVFKKYDPTKFVKLDGGGPPAPIEQEQHGFIWRLLHPGGSPTLDPAPSGSVPDIEGEDGIRRGQDLANRLRQRQPILPNDQFLRRDQQLQLQNQRLLQQQEQQRNLELRNQQQRALQRAAAERLSEQLNRNSQQRQHQMALEQRNRDQARLQDQLRRQTDALRQQQAQLAQQRAADAQHRAEQQRQQQMARTEWTRSRPPPVYGGAFVRPFVSPKLWQSPVTKMTLPPHVYSAPPPRPAPRPFTPPPFSRPSLGGRYS